MGAGETPDQRGSFLAAPFSMAVGAAQPLVVCAAAPMNGVTGMTGLALKTRLTSQQKNYLQVVKQSADALLRLGRLR